MVTELSKRVTITLGLMLLGPMSACTDGHDPAAVDVAVPGVMSLRWSAAEPVGAVQLTIDGPILGEVGTPQQDAVVFVRSDGKRKNVAIIGALTDGVLLTFAVPDSRRKELYVVRLIEVAGLDNEIRPLHGGFNVTVE